LPAGHVLRAEKNLQGLAVYGDEQQIIARSGYRENSLLYSVGFSFPCSAFLQVAVRDFDPVGVYSRLYATLLQRVLVLLGYRKLGDNCENVEGRYSEETGSSMVITWNAAFKL
jgi:hypothetical protein